MWIVPRIQNATSQERNNGAGSVPGPAPAWPTNEAPGTSPQTLRGCQGKPRLRHWRISSAHPHHRWGSVKVRDWIRPDYTPTGGGVSGHAPGEAQRHSASRAPCRACRSFTPPPQRGCAPSDSSTARARDQVGNVGRKRHSHLDDLKRPQKDSRALSSVLKNVQRHLQGFMFLVRVQ